MKFKGGETFEDTGRVWAGFNVFQKKLEKLERREPSIGMGIVKKVGKGNVTGRATRRRADKGARGGRRHGPYQKCLQEADPEECLERY